MGVTTSGHNNIPQLIAQLRKLGKTKIQVGVFGEDGSELVTIAAANEFGAIIKPKRKKWLALPTPNAKGKRPKDFNDLRFVMVQEHKKALLVRDVAGSKGGKNEKSVVMFILLKKVIIPERSFLRSGFDENIGHITAKIKKHMNDVMRFKIRHDVFADMIGLEMAGLVQKKLRNLSTPSNAPLTKANKKSDNPLINTGRLVRAIRHKVE